MVTVEFTEAEARAAAGAVWAYIDDDYYPRIDMKALSTANYKLTRAIDRAEHHGLTTGAA